MRCLPFVAALVALGGAASDGPAQELERTLAIAREVERLAKEHSLWPGFDPLEVPLAIYSGTRTYLFRHPAPPSGFTPVASASLAAHTFEGRHPAVTSNSSADIGETPTATLLADGPRSSHSSTQLAATALHEAFHVFQRAHHPDWAANEGDLLLYPVDDARLLTLRRLETRALERALEARDEAVAVCWTRAVLRLRAERYSGLEDPFSRYERLTELNEGLATYVERRAMGATTIRRTAEFGATAARQRAYFTGAALAMLLDRLHSGWKAALASDGRQHLDALLGSAVAARAPVPEGCDFSADERAAVGMQARTDAEAVAETRARKRADFDARSGWRVVVVTSGQPLWPQEFDPMNTDLVNGALLHTRLLRLGNDAGELHMIHEGGADPHALTEGAGAHPLFNGVHRVTIAGLSRPAISVEGGVIAITAPALELRMRGAAETNGMVVTVRLDAGG